MALQQQHENIVSKLTFLIEVQLESTAIGISKWLVHQPQTIPSSKMVSRADRKLSRIVFFEAECGPNAARSPLIKQQRDEKRSVSKARATHR